MKKIFAVAPLPSIEENIKTVYRERIHELSCDIRVVNSLGILDAVPSFVQEAREWGADVIVSRGGTAQLINKLIDIPVILIQVTALDILEALGRAKPYSEHVGVAGIDNIIYECESLNEYLGTTLKEIVLYNREEDLELLRTAARSGIDTIVGDTTAARLAKSLGLKGLVINSGKAAVYKAIKEAERVINVQNKERERTELLRAIIDFSTDGIIAVDRDARITIFNPIAETLFSVSRNMAIGRPIADVIPVAGLNQVFKAATAEPGEVKYIGERALAIKRIPIKVAGEIVGVITNFQEVTQLQRFEQTIRQKIHKRGLTAKYTIDDIIGNSKSILKAKEQARRYAANHSTVLITGETGTGKEMFAQSIHNLSARHGTICRG